LKLVAGADWIIEAVVENLELKRELLRKVEALRKPGTIITTNTSGLPVAKIAEGFSEDFRRNWFGTHFFNPPRYMRLLEIIPTPDSDRAAMEVIANFCDLRLGKGIVNAKDTPNFIANRIGTFSVLNVMRVMQEMDLSIEEVDALTGSAVGWPKSATFRTIDLVGLDILGHVVNNMTGKVKDERSELRLPSFYNKMLERKLLGDKTKGGFYKKQRGADGKDERFGIDWKTLEYRPQQKPTFAALDMAKNVDSNAERLRMLLSGDPQKDPVSKFLWAVLPDLWNYAADGVGCVEFHSKMNSLGGDIVQMVSSTLKPGSELGANFDAFVITNDAQHFSVGANIMMLLMAIQEEEWDDVDMMIRQFQGMTQL